MKLWTAIKAFFAALFVRAKATGTAAVKLAETDLKLIEAKARVAAIDLENRIKAEAVAFLKTEADRVHTAHDALRADLISVIEKL